MKAERLHDAGGLSRYALPFQDYAVAPLPRDRAREMSVEAAWLTAIGSLRDVLFVESGAGAIGKDHDRETGLDLLAPAAP